jgi:asparagine synthase (glutamine-hydrolysing)
MCGFVVGSKKQYDINKSLQLIKHRGPDALQLLETDDLIFGFARLSIMDLEIRSNQPFQKDNKLIMTFNGEIYNYLEIKNQLIKHGISFDTTGDTEVVYEAFKYWGIDCFSKFEGMFAVVLYDSISRELIIARDQLGIKPIYFARRNDSDILIASELKVFMDNGYNRVRREAIKDYLCYGIHFTEKTLIHDVNEVKPGSYIYFKKNGLVESKEYFNLKDTFGLKQGTDYGDIFDSLDKSIRLHTQADVEIGLQASGGLDSSIILANTHKHSNGFKSFSVNVKHSLLSEEYWQNELNKLYPHENKTVYYHQAEDLSLKQDWIESTYYHDLPLHHPNIIPSDAMNAVANSQGLKVLLSGDGADEIFCGYPWSRDSTNSKYDISSSAWIPVDYYEEVFNDFPSYFNIEEMKYGMEKENIQTYFDQRYYIQKWFHRQDRSGMRNNIEIRVPFATKSLVELVNPISIEKKTFGGIQPKHYLKKYAEAYFPDNFIYRKKVGFSIPINDWYSNVLFSQDLIDILKEFNLFNAKIRTMVNQGPSDKHSGRMLWSLLSFAIWVQKFEMK